MSLARDVIDRLRAAMARVADARAAATVVRGQADEIIIEVQAATDGSGDDRPAEAVVRLQQAQVRLDEAIAEFNAGDAAIEEYVSDAFGGPSTAVGAPQPDPVRAQPIAPKPFKPMRTDPDKRDEIKPYVGLDYAVATLWDQDGRRILGPHRADDDGPAATANWKLPWRDYPRLRRHVEAHAAARMTSGDVLAMYINMKPCSYTDGCELNLREIIPGGAMLIVHWVKSNGTVEVLRFPGTGRGVDDG